MRVLPGAAGAEFAPFAAGVTRMQQVLGEHFAPAQGGRPTPARRSAALLRMDCGARAAAPVPRIGQSSWGPTGFAILPSQARPKRWPTPRARRWSSRRPDAAHRVRPQPRRQR